MLCFPKILVAIAILTAPSVFPQVAPELSHPQREFLDKLVAAAVERTHHTVRYDPAYVRIPYPGGDVPADTGVCTDEIIRIYRVLGVDLQKEVHEDIVRNFNLYPHKWLPHPDSNIDHRRVPNLMVFFSRKGEAPPATQRSEVYSPGDIGAWKLGGGVTRIGVVISRRGTSGHYMVLHNIGRGPGVEDVLFDWAIIGPCLYYGPAAFGIGLPPNAVHR